MAKALALLDYARVLYEQQDNVLKKMFPPERPSDRQSYNRLPGPSPACHNLATLLSVAPLRTSTTSHTAGFYRQCQRSLVLPQMRWGYGGHRAVYFCPDPASFATSPGHGSRMRRPSTSRNLCVSRRAQSLCALPFYKSRFLSFSSLRSAPVLRFTQRSSILRCPLCSAASPQCTSTPPLPSIQSQ
jgi:hypothetical protein